MKIRPAWLAAALLVFVLLACNLGKKDANQSSNQATNRAPGDSPSPIAASTGVIKEIKMAKDDGDGGPGDETDTFGPEDRTIHCVVKLAEPKSGTKIRFSWWTVDTEGSKNEKIKDIDYTTKARENVVHGHLSLPQDWPQGKYRVEVYVNGNLEETVEYRVS